MKKSIFLSFILILFLTACSVGVQNAGQNEKGKNSAIQTIKVGVIMPLSGDAAAYGEEAKRIFDFELPKINEEFISKGYQFELVYEDGKCNGAESVTAFNKLTDINNISFLLGGFCSSESMGLIPLLADKKILALSGGSSSPELKGKSPNFFSLSYDDDVVGKGVADELGKYKKIAMLTEQNDYNQAMKKTTLTALQEKYPDSRIVADEEFSKGGTEFRNQLEKIKAADPEVLFINSNPGVTTESLIRQLAEHKDWVLSKVGAYNLMSEKTLAIVPEILEGAVIIDTPKMNNPEFLSVIRQIVQEKGSLDNLGNYYTASYLDVLRLMAEVIAQSGNNSVKALKLLSEGTFEGYIGKIHFGGNTFVQGIGTARFVIKNGKVETFDL